MIYVLMFDRPLGSANPRGAANYYVGWSEDDRVLARFAEHTSGQGAAITRAAVKSGIGLTMVAMFEGDRAKEREIKNYKNTRLWLKSHIKQAVWVHPSMAAVAAVAAAPAPATLPMFPELAVGV